MTVDVYLISTTLQSYLNHTFSASFSLPLWKNLTGVVYISFPLNPGGNCSLLPLKSFSKNYWWGNIIIYIETWHWLWDCGVCGWLCWVGLVCLIVHHAEHYGKWLLWSYKKLPFAVADGLWWIFLWHFLRWANLGGRSDKWTINPVC